MRMYRFKDGVVPAIVGPGHQTRSSHQTSTHVAHHVPVQVGHHHHVELVRLGHQLQTQTKDEAGSTPFMTHQTLQSCH